MTYRDPAPTIPACPVCDRAAEVKRHDNPHQGKWLALCCMVLFSDTSAEWARPERPSEDIKEQLDAARAVLKEAAER